MVTIWIIGYPHTLMLFMGLGQKILKGYGHTCDPNSKVIWSHWPQNLVKTIGHCIHILWCVSKLFVSNFDILLSICCFRGALCFEIMLVHFVVYLLSLNGSCYVRILQHFLQFLCIKYWNRYTNLTDTVKSKFASLYRCISCIKGEGPNKNWSRSVDTFFEK